MSDSPGLIDRYKLRDKRLRARLSQTALAERVGLRQSYISMLESGERGGGPETLGNFAEFFGCDITDLMPDEPVAA